MMGIGHTPSACVVLTVGGWEHRVHLKLEDANPFGSLKDRTAASLVDDLERRGLLRPGSILVESTPGIALVRVSSWMVRIEHRRRLGHLRRDEVAAVQLVCGPSGPGCLEETIAGIVESAAASSITPGPCRSACPSVGEAGLRSGGSHDVAKSDKTPGQHRDSTGPQIQGFLAHLAHGLMRVSACCLRWICPQRDSNPRYSLERAVTWAASRWGPCAECRGEPEQLPFAA